MELTVMGGRGFVGGHYAKLYPRCIVNDREDYETHSADVLYLISTVHNYHVFDRPLLDIETNLSTLVRVLENWRHFQGKGGPSGVFNFVSSWFVYGRQADPHGVREDAVCDPRGFYSITKRCAEQLLASYCEAYGLRYRILRLGSVIGPGDRKASAKKNAVQHMVNLLARGEPVEIYGDGCSYRDFIHVDDCAAAINRVVLQGAVNEIYNIGNGRSWTLKEVILYAATKLRSSSRISFIEPKDFHKKVQVASFYMDSGKLRGLGYSPRFIGSRLFDGLLEDAR